MKNKIKKMIKAFVIILAILGIIILCFYKYSTEKKSFFRKCNYQLLDINEYKGRYGEDEYVNNYVVYEGLLKNTSDKTENLKAVIVKLYNEKDIYIGDGYSPIEEYVEPGVSIPFKIHILIPTAHDTAIRKYLNESNTFKPDIYAWFTTCE